MPQHPVRFLDSYNIKGREVNNIANRTPLLAATNQAIGKDAPHVYTNNVDIVGSRGLSEDTLRQHCVSAKILSTPFNEHVYKEFLADRSQRLLRRIQDLVGAPPLADD